MKIIKKLQKIKKTELPIFYFFIILNICQFLIGNN